MKNEVNKKNIALIIADENELNNILWNKKNEIIIGDYSFTEYEYNSNLIYLVHSKIGLINASITTTILINQFKVEAIFNLGSCGGLGYFNVNQIVIPYKLCFFDALTPWYKNGQIPQEKEYFINDFYINDWANQFIQQYKNDQYRILSSMGFIFNEDQSAYWTKYFYNENIYDIFDMEAAAIAYSCDKFKIPFYSMKIVSDVILKNNISKNKINQRIEENTKPLFDLAIKIIEFYLSN